MKNADMSPTQLFIRGYLYAFGLVENPIISLLNKRRKKSDTDRMRGDWMMIGNDIRKAYEQETATTAK